MPHLCSQLFKINNLFLFLVNEISGKRRFYYIQKTVILIQNNTFVKVITFGFARGIALFPFVITNRNPKAEDINHEKIHLQQQKELWVIIFYIWYLIEWVFKGYRNISFEIEAYRNDKDLDYLKNRRKYNFTHYLRNS
jgi:hypothetical protein